MASSFGELNSALSKRLELAKEQLRLLYRTSNDTFHTLKEEGDFQQLLRVQPLPVLRIKNLGRQIAWKTVFLLEYFGPLLIFSGFYLAASRTATYLEKVACFLFLFHFIKREFESLFIHRFSHETMPLVNLWKNCTHYYGFSAFIGYQLFWQQAHYSDHKRIMLLSMLFLASLLHALTAL